MTPDPRFYILNSDVSLAQLAELTGAELNAPQYAAVRIRSVSILSAAGEGDVSYVSDRRFLAGLRAPTACFVTSAIQLNLPAGCAALVTRYPQAAYAAAANRLVTLRPHDGPGAVSAQAELEQDVILGPGAVVGPGARIGRGSVLGPNAVVGPGVTIGRDCAIGSNASIHCALIGDRVQIHANAVIGSAGFGAAAGPKGIVDLPQLGRVILQEGVTIGAGSKVDRGAFEDTVVGENTKIDNLVHIAHNVRVGRNCVMAAYTGISGSVTIGDGCRFGGRSGVADHLTIGDGAQIGAGAAVLRNVPAGETWSGFPAKPVRQWLREMAWLSKSAGKPRDGAKHDG